MLSFLWFLVIGILAGWLAGYFTRGDGFGCFGNLLLGVVGSMVGGLLVWMLGYEERGRFAELVTATLGAILFLYLMKRFWRKK